MATHDTVDKDQLARALWLRFVLLVSNLDEHKQARAQAERLAGAVESVPRKGWSEQMKLGSRTILDEQKRLHGAVAMYGEHGWQVLRQPQSGRGRPREHWLDALCEQAAAEGVTATELARAGVVLAGKGVFANASVGAGADIQSLLGVNAKTDVESLRQRLQKHWPHTETK